MAEIDPSIIREWLAARGVIAQALREFAGRRNVYSLAEEYAESILARLAAHDPPIMLKMEPKKEDTRYRGDTSQECPGHERGGKLPPCCARAGEYNGYGSDGPRLFSCPKSCSCHD